MVAKVYFFDFLACFTSKEPIVSFSRWDIIILAWITLNWVWKCRWSFIGRLHIEALGLKLYQMSFQWTNAQKIRNVHETMIREEMYKFTLKVFQKESLINQSNFEQFGAVLDILDQRWFVEIYILALYILSQSINRLKVYVSHCHINLMLITTPILYLIFKLIICCILEKICSFVCVFIMSCCFSHHFLFYLVGFFHFLQLVSNFLLYPSTVCTPETCKNAFFHIHS